ncbi:hypothetical protein MKZ38_002134 [Zalerion maritima]|uniref:RCC1-like domain-containing protein n=1 Tax=Zalerion maritima TaxID=339359 RepID=A0AAD5RQ13_9PEZI|nr:hypothetical protein MKZ38_002134 [Zalerion maritima]
MTTPTPFSLGSNSKGQLGIGHVEDVSTPQPVTFHLEPPTCGIKKVAAGGNHTLLLTKNGDVWAAGDILLGAYGPIEVTDGTGGTGGAEARCSTRSDNEENKQQQQHQNVFRQIPTLSKATHIASTWTAGIVVCRDTDLPASTGRQIVCSFGTELKGELGRTQTPREAPPETPVKIEDFPPLGTAVVDISASLNHVVVVLSDGSAWGWGASRKGQLGSIPGRGFFPGPTFIPNIPFPVKRAVAGNESTTFFSDPSSGKVHIHGGWKYKLKEHVPKEIPPWQDVAAGWSSLYVLTNDGQILSWGNNKYGQHAPPNLPRIVEMAAGSEHVVALTEEGGVISWGWGEHGNCGPIPHEPGECVPYGALIGRWNLIANAKFLKDGSRITGLGAGCATSWILVETEGLVL